MKLSKASKPFTELFNHGTLKIELYKPDQIDHQQPHKQDEVYVIVSGRGTFYHGGTSTVFQPGDLLFVPAGEEHRFERFTSDFVTWVIFYGPEGGEREA